MSTRGTISALLANGQVQTIYLHHAYDADDILLELQIYYDHPNKVRELIKLGDLSSFGKSTECPEGHSFANRVGGHCVAYHRDRGDPVRHTRARTYANIERAMHGERDQNNFYYDGEKWTML